MGFLVIGSICGNHFYFHFYLDLFSVGNYDCINRLVNTHLAPIGFLSYTPHHSRANIPCQQIYAQ